VALARTGDRAAFGRLIEDHLTAARRVALAAVGQAMDADEAVQDASLAAWTRLHALQDPAAFRGWFMRIVWRKAIDRRRSLRSWLDRFGVSSSDGRPMEYPAADPSPDALLISRELATAIGQVVKALPRRLRDPFLLRGKRRSSLRGHCGHVGCSDRHRQVAHLRSTPADRMKLDRLGHGDPR
jgi:RNA polymerase sigma-70 factor (ECF subfamily)